MHVFAVIGLTLSASQAWPQATTENKPHQEESTANTEDNGDQHQEESRSISSILEGIEAAIRDLIAEEDKIAREANESRENRDLDAQEGMAWWAEMMFYAAGATAVLTLLALVAIIRTLHHTRRAADSADGMLVEARKTTIAALASAETAQRIGEAQVRAYVSVAEAEFSILEDQIVIGVKLQNAGQSPAFMVKAGSRLILQAAGGMEHSPRVLSSVTSEYSDEQFNAIPAMGNSIGELRFLYNYHFARDAAEELPSFDDVFSIANGMIAEIGITWTDILGVSHSLKAEFFADFDAGPYAPEIAERMNTGVMEIRAHDPKTGET
jgi:hypothetical protein